MNWEVVPPVISAIAAAASIVFAIRSEIASRKSNAAQEAAADAQQLAAEAQRAATQIASEALAAQHLAVEAQQRAAEALEETRREQRKAVEAQRHAAAAASAIDEHLADWRKDQQARRDAPPWKVKKKGTYEFQLKNTSPYPVTNVRINGALNDDNENEFEKVPAGAAVNFIWIDDQPLGGKEQDEFDIEITWTRPDGQPQTWQTRMPS